MKEIHVPIKDNEYNIIIGKGLIKSIDKYLDTNKDYVIITDSNIPKIYIDAITSKCLVKHVYIVPPGESSKSMETADLLLNRLVDDGVPRSITIIALGGGVIGDLAGFVASVYMRGVSYIQIPTSLLAQVDSSVGGKVAVNAKNMKNAIGSFYQPKLVLIDPDTLNTLEERHFNNGVAEIIKYALIKDAELFEELASISIINNIIYIIYKCLIIKRNIVINDVLDIGERQLLNYGHTLGHAIEQDSNYKLLHGEAVALGMQMMAKQTNFSGKLQEIIKKYNLPTTYDYNKEDLYHLIKTDKKVTKDTLNHVIVEEPGKGFIKKIKLEQIKEYM